MLRVRPLRLVGLLPSQDLVLLSVQQGRLGQKQPSQAVHPLQPPGQEGVYLYNRSNLELEDDVFRLGSVDWTPDNRIESCHG